MSLWKPQPEAVPDLGDSRVGRAQKAPSQPWGWAPGEGSLPGAGTASLAQSDDTLAALQAPG